MNAADQLVALLARATTDGQRLYEVRMHGEPTIRDDNRVDGILTIDLPRALDLARALAVSVPPHKAQT